MSLLRRGILGLVAAALTVGSVGCVSFRQESVASAEAQPFYYDLAPYGQWVYVSPWGWVWEPIAMPADFMPYASEGHWVLTTAGWVFESFYPWSNIVYHYGRWVHAGHRGWVWWPDTVWGPAWVAWRCGDGYRGWRPLGPREDHEGHEHGGRGSDPVAYNVPNSWTFVRDGSFTEERVLAHAEPKASNPGLVARTVGTRGPVSPLPEAERPGERPVLESTEPSGGATHRRAVLPPPPAPAQPWQPVDHRPLPRGTGDAMRPPPQPVIPLRPPPAQSQPIPSRPVMQAQPVAPSQPMRPVQAPPPSVPRPPPPMAIPRAAPPAASMQMRPQQSFMPSSPSPSPSSNKKKK